MGDISSFQANLLAQLSANSEAKKAEAARRREAQIAAARRAAAQREAAEQERKRQEAERFYRKSAGKHSLFGGPSRKSSPISKRTVANGRSSGPGGASSKRRDRKRKNVHDDDDAIDDGYTADGTLRSAKRDRSAMALAARRKREGGMPSKPLPGMEFVVRKNPTPGARNTEKMRKNYQVDYSDLFGPDLALDQLGGISRKSASGSNNKTDDNSCKDSLGTSKPTSTGSSLTIKKGDAKDDIGDIRKRNEAKRENARRLIEEAAAQVERDRKNGKVSESKRNKRRLESSKEEWVAVDVPIPMGKATDKVNGGANSDRLNGGNIVKSAAAKIAEDAKRKKDLEERKRALARSFGATLAPKEKDSARRESSSSPPRAGGKRSRSDDDEKGEEDDLFDLERAGVKREKTELIGSIGSRRNSIDERRHGGGSANANGVRRRSSNEIAERDRFRDRERCKDRERDESADGRSKRRHERNVDLRRKKRNSSSTRISDMSDVEEESSDDDGERRGNGRGRGRGSGRMSGGSGRRRDRSPERPSSSRGGRGSSKSNNAYYSSVYSDDEDFEEINEKDSYSDGGGRGGLPRFTDLDEIEEEELESSRAAQREDRIEFLKEKKRKREKELRKRAYEGDSDSD